MESENEQVIESESESEQAIDPIKTLTDMVTKLQESVEKNNKELADKINKQDSKFKSFAENYISNAKIEPKQEQKQEQEPKLDDNDPSWWF